MARLPGATQDARIVGGRYVRSQRRANPGGRMPLFDHLRELRHRVVKMASALAAGDANRQHPATSGGLVFAGSTRAVPVWRVRLPFRSGRCRRG